MKNKNKFALSEGGLNTVYIYFKIYFLLLVNLL